MCRLAKKYLYLVKYYKNAENKKCYYMENVGEIVFDPQFCQNINDK